MNCVGAIPTVRLEANVSGHETQYMSLELATVASNVVLTSGAAGGPALGPAAASAIAVGLAAFGAGYSQRGIGAAAVGAMAEDESLFGKGLILTVLPETLIILALIVVVLIGL